MRDASHRKKDAQLRRSQMDQVSTKAMFTAAVRMLRQKGYLGEEDKIAYLSGINSAICIRLLPNNSFRLQKYKLYQKNLYKYQKIVQL